MIINNKIVDAKTRRDIFDWITANNISWSDRLQESNFPSRIFDLERMPSFDSRFETANGDIWQHKERNLNWDDDWIFSDSRFNLMQCDDSIFLEFLCQTIHPIVRSEIFDINKIVTVYNDILKNFGIEFFVESYIGGLSVHDSRQITLNSKLTTSTTTEQILTRQYIKKQNIRMNDAIESDPDLAIGTSKELIETICKTILDECGVTYSERGDLPKLIKITRGVLEFLPENIPEATKGRESITKILNSLSTVVQGITELRNLYGTGHGKTANSSGLQPRHARLAVHAATTIVDFFFSTYQHRLTKNPSPQE